MLRNRNSLRSYNDYFYGTGEGHPAVGRFLSGRPSTFPAYEIAYALGNTGSRTAVPVLIELLANTDDGIRRAAGEALYNLTHRKSNGDDFGADRQDWLAWWGVEGKAAQIFDPTQCP
jgi:hypothetical protein